MILSIFISDFDRLKLLFTILIFFYHGLKLVFVNGCFMFEFANFLVFFSNFRHKLFSYLFKLIFTI
ncbi:hypothetical protein HanIR_Chr09g0422341 [Helianthus annuus]|nr:hypothetical protein HanIR_Chr09g0422341 [Helianthus annuus]